MVKVLLMTLSFFTPRKETLWCSFPSDFEKYVVRLGITDVTWGQILHITTVVLSTLSLPIWLALLKCQFSLWRLSQHGDGWRLCPVYHCVLPQLTAWWKGRRGVLTFSFINGIDACVTAEAFLLRLSAFTCSKYCLSMAEVEPNWISHIQTTSLR